MSLKVIKITDDMRANLLPSLKLYLGAVDSAQDPVLQSCLTNAVLEIQDRADASVVSCLLELRVDNNASRVVKLYQTPSEVVSVQLPDGSDVNYTYEDRQVVTEGICPSLVIRYTTMPDSFQVARLRALVNQYATALYDGQTDELAKIIAQC